MTSDALHRLCRNDRAMIRWICGVKLSDDPSMDDLHAKLGICDLAILVREHRLRWFGHVMRSNGEINRVRSRSVPGRKGPGRPKKTWDEFVKQDLKVCGLFEAGTQDRVSWRSSVKNSRQEPTPSNGSASQSMAAPLTQRVLIAGTLGCVFNDNETHESGVTKCTTGEAWSAFSWHHSSVFHCQWTHNQVFLLLSHMLIKNAKSIFIYVMKYVSGFIWKLGINFALFIKWIDETWWNNRLLLVPNCYEVVAMVATMVAMVAPLWCHTLR